MFGLKKGKPKRKEIPKETYSQEVGIFHEPTRMQSLITWALPLPKTPLEDDDGKLCIIEDIDHSVFTVFSFRGPDLGSATFEELMQYNAQLNNVLKTLPTGFVMYVEAQRRQSTTYDESEMPSPLLQQMENERKAYYQGKDHFETTYYLVLYQMPPDFIKDRLTNAVIARGKSAKERSQEEKKDTRLLYEFWNKFQDRAALLYNLLQPVFKDLQPLNTNETLTYLHSIVSDKYVPIQFNPNRYILTYVTDAPLLGGMNPKLGKKFMKVVTIMDFPTISRPGVFDSFNALNIEYRWVSRFIFLSKLDAEKEIANYQSRWSQQIKGIFRTFLEAANLAKDEAKLNQMAITNEADAGAALMEVQQDAVAEGFYTMSMIVMDENETACTDKANLILETLNSMGYTGYIETVNSVEAYRGTLPGCYKCNIRRPLVNTLNFCHLAPFTSMWSGDKKNSHLKGPVLLYTDSYGYTPFRLSLHDGDVGHTMIVGPTGSGKSVLLNTLEAHFLKYPQSNVFIFDKAASSRALTYAVNGSFYNLAAEGNKDLSFQPLAHIDEPSEMNWAKDWILSYLQSKNVEITPEEETHVWKALQDLSVMPPAQRTFSTFNTLVQSVEIRQALLALTLKGSYGKLFDNDTEYAGNGRWIVYEMEALMNTPAIVPNTLDYLFHCIEKKINRASGPSIIVLDECWLFLDNEAFRSKLREYFKDMRKKNTSIWIATQNLSDIAAKQDLLNTVNDQCVNKIFLPNVNATNEQNAPLYQTFGCNERQRQIISRMTPKQDYYYCGKKGNRVFRLALQPSEFPFVTATSKSDQLQMNRIIQQGKQDEFIREWFLYKDFPQEWEKLEKAYAQ